MTYAATKFEVATSNGLGRDTFTRNLTDGRTDERWTDFGTTLIYIDIINNKYVYIISCFLYGAVMWDPYGTDLGNPIWDWDRSRQSHIA